jgi:hypothetical protein
VKVHFAGEPTATKSAEMILEQPNATVNLGADVPFVPFGVHVIKLGK